MWRQRGLYVDAIRVKTISKSMKFYTIPFFIASKNNPFQWKLMEGSRQMKTLTDTPF
jgi:hypothetical protein